MLCSDLSRYSERASHETEPTSQYFYYQPVALVDVYCDLAGQWIFEPLDGGADLQDPNHAADHDKDNGGGGDDVKEPSEADRKKKAEEYLRTKSPALITWGIP